MTGTILSFYNVQVPLTDAYRMVFTASVHTVQTSLPIFIYRFGINPGHKKYHTQQDKPNPWSTLQGRFCLAETIKAAFIALTNGISRSGVRRFWKLSVVIPDSKIGAISNPRSNELIISSRERSLSQWDSGHETLKMRSTTSFSSHWRSVVYHKDSICLLSLPCTMALVSGSVI